MRTTTPSVLALVHHDPSDVGEAGSAVVRAGYALEIRQPNAGSPLPDRPQDYAAIMLFGGVMSVRNGHGRELAAEIALVACAIEHSVPVLGICLGAQIVARALDARVYRHPQGASEIGFLPVKVVERGREVLAGLPERVYQWHEDGFDLPNGATRLATSEFFPNQAFQFGGNVLALQFHPELRDWQLPNWLTGFDPVLCSQPSVHPAEKQMLDAGVWAARQNAWCERLVRRWLAAAHQQQ